MRRAARAIIIRDEKLLVMHRDKFGSKYDTLPGGNVELGESLEQALYREVIDETSIEFRNPLLVFVEHAGQPWGDQYIYLCDYVSGEPVLTPDSEEDIINRMGQNLYRPGWRSLEQLAETPFRSEKLRDLILRYHHDGWPEKPVEIAH